MKKQSLLNTRVNNVSMEEAASWILENVRQKKTSYVVEVNTDVVMKMEKDPYLRKIADEADLNLVDGKPLVWISRLYKRPVKEKISGSDLVPEVIRRAAKEGVSIYILGGTGDTPKKAAMRLKAKFPTLHIAGVYAPPWGFEKDEKELAGINARIQKVHPDILLACFGCPKQEKWVYENYQKTSATVTICAGATVDFLAGTVKRAPRWVSELGFEWFYRFLKEPGRLFRRYFVDDVQIIGLIWKYRRTR